MLNAELPSDCPDLEHAPNSGWCPTADDNHCLGKQQKSEREREEEKQGECFIITVFQTELQ